MAWGFPSRREFFMRDMWLSSPPKRGDRRGGFKEGWPIFERRKKTTPSRFGHGSFHLSKSAEVYCLRGRVQREARYREQMALGSLLKELNVRPRIRKRTQQTLKGLEPLLPTGKGSNAGGRKDFCGGRNIKKKRNHASPWGGGSDKPRGKRENLTWEEPSCLEVKDGPLKKKACKKREAGRDHI